MSHRKTTPAGKPWVPLTDVETPFDQTNGVVDFDTDAKDTRDDATLTLLEKGAAGSMLNGGLGGLGG